MAERTWQTEKTFYCERAGQMVTIENEVALPAEYMPEQPLRVIARKCSHAIECNLIEHPVCSLCGTNPDLDPV